MFGIPLSDICKREGSHVPFIVRRIVKHIEDEGLDQEGIYRVNGNAKVIERLKADFDRGKNIIIIIATCNWIYMNNLFLDYGI